MLSRFLVFLLYSVIICSCIVCHSLRPYFCLLYLTLPPVSPPPLFLSGSLDFSYGFVLGPHASSRHMVAHSPSSITFPLSSLHQPHTYNFADPYNSHPIKSPSNPSHTQT
ncbi:hypothetical protein FRC12_018572 [Ceratobasidium sp. 428]|nr:hypothetical protein FRC12_018572 [Ceratobasidium sp. 428]